ncbi:ly6/PLAUR domain-containing protein 3-like [Xenopus laevis]|uniref:Ly6/PLAUR domain-containing protein 3-like n=1 Tax=Xenopus laevis TaxID=8355 RepID=A0A8J1LDG8_XENLA|nr:ly6/PLAUR domain-containing protein 3-like [Xenopus laevis]
MESISQRTCRRTMITNIFLVLVLLIPGAEAENLECYSCVDYNDGSCSEDKAAKTSCSPDQNCIETNATLETSHNYSYLMVKGCGNRSIEDMLELVPFYGINLYFHLSQCNSSLCNNLNNEKTIYPEKVTPEPNNVQCYSCIGNTGAECSSSNVTIVNCYGKYEYCFDGNINLTTGNQTVVIPIKSCSLRSRCPIQTLSSESLSLEIKGACCEGNLCNRDLSNRTQYVDLPPLVLLEDLTSKKNSSLNMTTV